MASTRASNIIGIAGKAGSGKDTVAALIAEAEPTTVMSFATPIKEAAMLIFAPHGITHDQVYGPSELRNTQIGDLCRPDGEPLTVRHVLQTLGTDWGRKCCYPNIWVDLALRAAQQANALVVFTDCRFDNEFQALHAAGAQLWHVDRPDHTSGLSDQAASHASEQDLSGSLLRQLRTHFISNNKTLENLATVVARFMHERQA